MIEFPSLLFIHIRGGGIDVTLQKNDYSLYCNSTILDIVPNHGYLLFSTRTFQSLEKGLKQYCNIEIGDIVPNYVYLFCSAFLSLEKEFKAILQ